MAGALIILLSALFVVGEAEWRPTSWQQCRTNSDCQVSQCCSITPALGRRASPTSPSFPDFVWYCLPYKTEANPWCVLADVYQPSTPNYMGLCPCGPGLQCAPSDELDPKSYPRDKFGRCKPVSP